MTKKRELAQEEEHMLEVLRGKRFLQMEGLSNEVPFFIYAFPPEAAITVEKAKGRIKKKLSTRYGVNVREVNLYELAVDILERREVWDRVLAMEPEQDKDEFREALQGMLDPQDHIAPAIKERIKDGGYDILFLTGIGEVFPYIRSHNVLNNLQSVVTDKPMLIFFPGRYEQSDDLGSSLVLFGRLKDDQYYRAKNILEQEA